MSNADPGLGAVPDGHLETDAEKSLGGETPDGRALGGETPGGESPDDRALGGETLGGRLWLRRLGRWLAIAFVAGSFVFWAWAFSPWARSENPGRLDNREFASWARQRCALTQDAVNALPSARQAASRVQRADQVDLGTAEVEALVSDLRGRADQSLARVSDDSGPADGELVDSWLADWAVYIEDRHRFAARLRDPADDTPDREMRFLLVDMVEGSTYTERMDGFARLNDMDACQTPGDV